MDSRTYWDEELAPKCVSRAPIHRAPLLGCIQLFQLFAFQIRAFSSHCRTHRDEDECPKCVGGVPMRVEAYSQFLFFVRFALFFCNIPALQPFCRWNTKHERSDVGLSVPSQKAQCLALALFFTFYLFFNSLFLASFFILSSIQCFFSFCFILVFSLILHILVHFTTLSSSR